MSRSPIPKLPRLLASGLALLVLVALIIVSIVQVYEVVFAAMLASRTLRSAVLVGALLAAAIPFGYMVTNTCVLCGIVARRLRGGAKRLRE